MPDSSSEPHASLWVSAGLFLATTVASQVIQNRRRQQEEQQAKHEQDVALGRSYSMKRMGHLQHEHEHSKSEMSLESRNHVADFEPKNSNWNHFETPDDDYDQEDQQQQEDEDDDDQSTVSEEEFLWTNNSIRRRRASSVTRSPTNVSWATKLRRSFSSFTMSSSTIQDNDEDEVGDMNDGWSNVHTGPRRMPRRQSSAPLPGTSVVPRRASYEPQDRNRVARRRYNARIMPNKVVLMRHGQSMGNIDEGLYSTTPDNAMPLTKLGWEQARKAGQVLKDQVLPKGETVHFIVSPYVRTVETFHGVVSAWCDPAEFDYIADRGKRLKAWYGHLLDQGLTWHEDPRIREQDFGNYQVSLEQYWTHYWSMNVSDNSFLPTTTIGPRID